MPTSTGFSRTIAVQAWNITKRTPDIPDQAEEENAAERKMHRGD
jgi:hypothetical protein